MIITTLGEFGRLRHFSRSTWFQDLLDFSRGGRRFPTPTHQRDLLVVDRALPGTTEDRGVLTFIKDPRTSDGTAMNPNLAGFRASWHPRVRRRLRGQTQGAGRPPSRAGGEPRVRRIRQ